MARRTTPGPAQLSAWQAFLRAHARVIDALDAELRASHGLPLTWYDALVQLHEAGGRLRMSELADSLLLSRSNCTRLVDRMDAAGLVAREPDPSDARSRWAVLTTAGRNQLRHAAGDHLAGVERYFARHFDEPAADELRERLERVVDSLPPGSARE